MVFSIREETDKNNIGSNQFRELANICRHSDCYEEIEMLIRYNEAKVKNNNTSWASPMVNSGTTFADIVVGCMQKVKNASENEQLCMRDLSLFFGYFYWNTRIWAAQNKAAANVESGFKNKNNNYSGGSQRRK